MVRIRAPWVFACALILFALDFCFVLESKRFLSGAEELTGTVIDVHTWNDICGGGSKNSKRYPCTGFQAIVRLPIDNLEARDVPLAAGSIEGHDQSTVNADYAEGQKVSMIFNRDNPDKTARDNFWDVWLLPMIFFCPPLLCLYYSVRPKSGPEPTNEFSLNGVTIFGLAITAGCSILLQFWFIALVGIAGTRIYWRYRGTEHKFAGGVGLFSVFVAIYGVLGVTFQVLLTL